MELDVQIRDWREEVLNRLLSGAWEEYAASLTRGEIVELEANYETWVARAMNDSIEVGDADSEAA